MPKELVGKEYIDILVSKAFDDILTEELMELEAGFIPEDNVPSENLRKRIVSSFNKNKRIRIIKRTSIIMGRAAIILIAFYIVGLAAYTHVDAFKVVVNNLIMNWQESSVVLTPTEVTLDYAPVATPEINDEDGDTAVLETGIPIYVPDGFEQVSYLDFQDSIRIRYINNIGQSISFTKGGPNLFTTELSGREDKSHQIELNGIIVTYLESISEESEVIFYWVVDEQIFSVVADADINIQEIKKVISSIK